MMLRPPGLEVATGAGFFSPETIRRSAEKTPPCAPLPKKFGPRAQLSTCLLYLVPGHGSFTAMSFRPLQAYAPVTWTGQVQQPKQHHKAKQHKAKQHKAKQHKKSHEKHGNNH